MATEMTWYICIYGIAVVITPNGLTDVKAYCLGCWLAGRLAGYLVGLLAGCWLAAGQPAASGDWCRMVQHTTWPLLLWL